jgi:hypothetical protein
MADCVEEVGFRTGADEDVVDAAAGKPIEHELPTGMIFDMTGDQHVRDWALPQVAFHQMIAYAILREAGVPLGKVDYVPHMFGYVRPAPRQLDPLCWRRDCPVLTRSGHGAGQVRSAPRSTVLLRNRTPIVDVFQARGPRAATTSLFDASSPPCYCIILAAPEVLAMRLLLMH